MFGRLGPTLVTHPTMLRADRGNRAVRNHQQHLRHPRQGDGDKIVAILDGDEKIIHLFPIFHPFPQFVAPKLGRHGSGAAWQGARSIPAPPSPK